MVIFEGFALAVFDSLMKLGSSILLFVFRWVVGDLFYGVMAALHRTQFMTCNFMNYGYTYNHKLTIDSNAEVVKDRNKQPEQLPDEINILLNTKYKDDECNQARLYEVTLSALGKDYLRDLDGLDLLEVACGHGGGLHWFRTAHPNLQSITGVDRTVSINRQDILQGNATKLPIEDSSVDLVICVEAVHQFCNDARFFSEVRRVLRAGGRCLIADAMPHEDVPNVYGKMEHNGLQLQRELDLTAGVLQSRMDQEQSIKAMYASNWCTRVGARHFWHVMWGMPGTPIYNQMQNGQWLYYAAYFKKN